jgi:hypothetical protein
MEANAGGGYTLMQGEKTLFLKFGLPQAPSVAVEDFRVDGRPHGKVLRARPLAPTEKAWFVAVLSEDGSPRLSATETADGLTVSLDPATELRFQETSGEVTLTAP